MQHMILKCKYLSRQTVIVTAAFWFSLPYTLEFLQHNLFFLRVVFALFCFFIKGFPSHSYSLGSSRGFVLHYVLSAKSPGAAGLCTSWGFIFTAKPQSCFQAVQLHFCGDLALSFHYEENFSTGLCQQRATPPCLHWDVRAEQLTHSVPRAQVKEAAAGKAACLLCICQKMLGWTVSNHQSLLLWEEMKTRKAVRGSSVLLLPPHATPARGTPLTGVHTRDPTLVVGTECQGCAWRGWIHQHTALGNWVCFIISSLAPVLQTMYFTCEVKET